ncbi:hypothetical protein BOTBODRAFT_31539 [Botryobasidium botryosum FD-172 SS1]|uniref:Uncharacterized protein n=1 Tax=Botryobasidium botryosum (strain FD-172 SS1) TaxID=930990 RepID=A0A067MIP1_BOTB1|nr:hypothetical protein BOTBODRAFT_31539 [Botryobasidium botryosum FD-172 SS1]
MPSSPSSSPQFPSHIPAAAPLSITPAPSASLSPPYAHAQCTVSRHSLRASRTPHVGRHWKNVTNCPLQRLGSATRQPSRMHTPPNHRTTIKQQLSPFARVHITHEL